MNMRTLMRSKTLCYISLLLANQLEVGIQHQSLLPHLTLLRLTSLLIRWIQSSWDGLSSLICMKLINTFVINILLVCQNSQISIIKLIYDLSIENLPLNDEDIKNLKLFDIILWSNMSTSTYNLLKKHFMLELSMESIFMLQARVSRLSHVTERSYNCCINSCCCYTRSYAGLDSCPFCKHAWYDSEGHIYKVYKYLPIEPHIKSLYLRDGYAKVLCYHSLPRGGDHMEDIEDVFDGLH